MHKDEFLASDVVKEENLLFILKEERAKEKQLNH